jgi:glycerophosphoryl diester phosphodiesterase
VTHPPPTRDRAYPTLAEVVEICRGRIGMMVELKRPRVDTVERALPLLDDDADALLCFQRPPLEQARRLRPRLRTIQHVGFGVSIRRAAGAWGVGFRNDRLTRRGLAAAQRLGLLATVYTVNDPLRMRELASLGVAGVFTDRPDLARSVLSGRES